MKGHLGWIFLFWGIMVIGFFGGMVSGKDEITVIFFVGQMLAVCILNATFYLKPWE